MGAGGGLTSVDLISFILSNDPSADTAQLRRTDHPYSVVCAGTGISGKGSGNRGRDHFPVGTRRTSESKNPVTNISGKVENPFSARFVRPGAIPYIFPPGCSAESLFETFERLQRMGAVVGPHGVGKSALITALADWMEQHEIPCLRLELHDGQRTLSQETWALLEDRSEIVITVDGYEQLSTWTRYQLRRLSRKRRLGLIGTAHSDVELPLLYAPEPNEDLAWKIVQLLLERGEPLISREDVHESFARHQGNLREMLFDLYDLYELRRSQLSPPSSEP